MAAFQTLADQEPRQHWVFTVEVDGVFAGSCALFFQADTVVGYDFVIVKDLRRQKYGAAMLQWLVEFAAGQGARLAEK